jgi:hypothetical protein
MFIRVKIRFNPENTFNLAVCPNGAPLVMCLRNMCGDNVGCPAYPQASCRMNYRGHCSAEFVFPNGTIADCGKQGTK